MADQGAIGRQRGAYSGTKVRPGMLTSSARSGLVNSPTVLGVEHPPTSGAGATMRQATLGSGSGPRVYGGPIG